MTFLYALPMFRGRTRLFRALDACLGARVRVARFDVKLCTYLASAQDASFFVREEHNSILSDAIAALPDNGVFLDCGSNCGFYSALAARRLGSDGIVVSIEPSYREYTRLISAVSANSHDCTWVTMNVGVGAGHGVLHLDTTVGHTGMNRMSKEQIVGQACAVYPVDDLVESMLKDRSQIDLIKIDVEGFEMEVIRGVQNSLRQGKIRKLIIEVTDQFLKKSGSSKAELFGFLSDCGYDPQVRSEAWQYDEVFVPRQ